MDHHPAGHPAGALPCTDTAADDGAVSALAMVAHRLRCPHCAAPLRAGTRALRCPSGHSFDIARQGYASLLPGHRPHHGDGPAMVAAREKFLGRDHYRALRSTITALAVEHAPPGARLITDLAGGTGYYLAPVLDALPAAHGLIVDVSTPSLRRAARAHPRAAAIAADLRGELPIAAGAANVVLSVFGPRPAGKIARLLAPGGIVVLATATADHLRQLRSRLGTLGVDPRKSERLHDAFAGFEVVDDQPVDWRLALGRHDVKDLVAMGPSAHHLDAAQLCEAVVALPEVLGVSAAMSVTVLRPRR